MQYLALLRGINVGGKNKVDMKQLKSAFEQAGMESVSTYINSGNVIFNSDKQPGELVGILEGAIEKRFGFHVKVLVRDIDNIKRVVRELPDSWVNDKTMKCDCMFLWEEVANPKVVEQLAIKAGIDDVKYIDGAILWRVDRTEVTRSGMMKLVGTKLYKQMTIRNCNTVRRLFELMQDQAAT